MGVGSMTATFAQQLVDIILNGGSFGQCGNAESKVGMQLVLVTGEGDLAAVEVSRDVDESQIDPLNPDTFYVKFLYIADFSYMNTVSCDQQLLKVCDKDDSGFIDAFVYSDSVTFGANITYRLSADIMFYFDTFLEEVSI